MITITDLSWMAGVFDLKSSFYRKNNKTRTTPQLVVQIRSKDPAIINRLCVLTGVKPGYSPNRAAFDQRPCVTHCPEAHVHYDPKWSMPAASSWSVTGVAASIVLYNLRSFLTQPDSQEVNDFMREGLANATFAGRGARKTVDVIRRFEALGWDLPPKILQSLSSSEIEGGRAKPIRLSCGHERLTARPASQGTEVWCEPCHKYRVVVRRTG